MRVKTRMVRVRRRRPAVRRAVVLLLITLCAYLYMFALRGDPVQAILDARDEERVRREVSFDSLEIHAVRTAVCDSEETARVEAARYIPRGAAGYMLQEETWHILCAGYETEAQAKTVRDRLRAEENIACDVLGLVADKVSIYVTAAPSQIDALIACERRLRETETLLGALSLAADDGETPRSQIASAIEEAASLLDGALSDFKAAAGEGDETVCAPLQDMAGYAVTVLEKLAGEYGALGDTLFSGRVKDAFIRLRVAHIFWLDSLGA